MLGNKELDQIEERMRAVQEEIRRELRQVREEMRRRGIPPLQQSEKALLLIGMIARLRKDGEGFDEDGEEFCMTCDDATDTVHRLISEARNILGIED